MAPYLAMQAFHAHLEVKNTFLQFPTCLLAPPVERRSSSCPSLSRAGLRDEAPRQDRLALTGDCRKGKDFSGDSTDCGIRSVSSLDSTVDSPLHQAQEVVPERPRQTAVHEEARLNHEAGYYRVSETSRKDRYNTEDRCSWGGGGSPTSNGGSKKKYGRKNNILLRGLPFTATENEVFAFIEQAGARRSLAPGRPIVLLNNPQGRPSGFAEVYLANNADAPDVREKLHMRRLGTRYIEVLPPHSPKWGNGTPSGRQGGGYGGGGFRTGGGSWRR